MLEKLQKINSEIKIESVFNDSFKTYGKLINGFPFEQIVDYMENVSEIPVNGNVYIASVPEMEDKPLQDILSKSFFGEMPIQIGFCNGTNSSLNGLEYHKGSEINYAVTDMVLLLGNIWQIENNNFDSNDVKAFYVPKGTALEMYATTLHFAPCKTTDQGFKCVVILPEGTNLPLKEKIAKTTPEDELLFMSNKWLIVHQDAQKLIESGAYFGIKGNNIAVKY
jgi:hypothetical protein